MMINSRNIVPISLASRNFSEVAHLAERTGEVFLFKNNRPKFRLVDVEAHPEIEMTDAERYEFVARRLLARHRAAFLELAKAASECSQDPPSSRRTASPSAPRTPISSPPASPSPPAR